MEGNFKARCVDLQCANQGSYTIGKIYEIIDGQFMDDQGGKRPSDRKLKTFEDLVDYSMSKWEEVQDIKGGTTETISIYTKKNRVVATITKGERKFTQSVSLHKANGSFKTAVKMVIELLMDKFEVREIEAVPVGNGNFKARCIKTDDGGLTDGKIYEFVNGFGKWDDGEKMPQFKDNGIERFGCFDDLVKWFGEYGGTYWEEVKEDTPLTTINSKVGKNGVEIGDTIKVLASDYASNKYVAGGTYKVLDIESEKCPRVAEGTVYGVVTEAFEIIRKASDNPEATTPLTADGFKVGDSVRIKMERSGINTYALSEGTIEKYTGKNYTVSKVESDREKPVIRLKEDEINFAWNPELFELATDTPSFDWESFKSGKFAVHCDTEEKAREFLKECESQGIKWSFGQIPTAWNISDCTNKVYNCSQLKLTWSFKSDADNIIDYTPSKPTVKEVSRRAEVGEWVKILRVDGFTEEDHKVGDIFQAIKCTRGKSTNSAYYANREDGCGYVDFGDYVVLEGYIPEDKPTIKEVKRPAKVGEWIKVVKARDTRGRYSNGDIFFIDGHKERPDEKGFIWGRGISESEYVVLENYQPDNTPIDSNPELEQPISSSGMREVKREAKAGEYVKVVNAECTFGDYYNGDILKIIKVDDRINKPYYKDVAGRFLYNQEYVVLENFDYSIFPKNEPWRKAKVGDKIKVVKVKATGHKYSCEIGEVQLVTDVDGDGVRVENENFYWDRDKEYIIIEEAPEVKRTHRQAVAGEWIEILPTKEDGRVKVGDIYRVKMAGSIGIVIEDKNGKEVACLWNSEYAVLENYQPEKARN